VIGASREIAAAMGWSLPYALGVLTGWKMAPACCQAVLGMTSASPSTGAGRNG